jgi:hypothetical protein
MRYGVFCGSDGYPTDMRNTNRRLDLWQIQSSDYPADMRNLIWHKEMWLSALSWHSPLRARARSQPLPTIVKARAPLTTFPPGGRGAVRAGNGTRLARRLALPESRKVI